ncbi:MAG TPA: heavy metal translocating P-type ATPase [Tepidisphaeraceae bacterium]
MNDVSGTSPQLQEAAIQVNGMDCASCVAHVEKAAGRTEGVQSCDVNLARGRAVVRFDPSRTNPKAVADAITSVGYPAIPERADSDPAQLEQERLEHQHHEASAWLRRAIIAILLWLPVEATHWLLELFTGGHWAAHGGINWMTWVSLITSTLAIVFVGHGFYRSAWGALKRFTSNMDTLIALGATVAWGYSLVALIGYLLGWWHTLPALYFMESTGLLALISIGHWLEARARQSAGSAIRELLELAPATAHRLRDGDETEDVAVSELNIGDVVQVRPGEHVPVDGEVIGGTSTVDESMITGEAMPVRRQSGDPVIGGTVNIDGALRVRVTKVGSETALAQIVKLVERAQSSKPAIQRLADQVAAVFVPTVLMIALVTGVGWYVWGHVHHWDSAATWGRIAMAVCSVLIIACPCALGLAVPATLMVGTGRGARRGILMRDVDALQMAEKIDTVVLDKTGTVTQGKPIVAAVESLNGMTDEQVLRLAASAEQYSEHPLARAIVDAARDRNIELTDPDSFKNEPGHGVIAEVEGQTVLVGNEELIAHRGTGLQPVQGAPEHGLETRATMSTLVHVAMQRDGAIQRVGVISLVDQIKPDSVTAVTELHGLGLKTVLLTGDNRQTAEAIAKQVGIDDVRAEVKPDGKAAAVRELQNRNSRIAMVGDGINDAPALAQADLGIAIGSGSDIAKQTSDVVLVGGSLQGIATAIRLSRATMRKIRQNLFFAFLYNVLAIPLAAFGLLNPYIAAAAMALSDVTVLGNALLLRRSRID